MKKYIVSLFILAFAFIFNTNFVNANANIAGCTATSAYSVTTGQSCGQAVSECAPGDLFSAVTGHPCSGASQSNDSSAVSQFNALLKNSFTVGVHGDDVKVLQQFLKDQSYYFGKIDGKYGRITARAVKDFQGDNNLDTTTQTFAPVASISDASTTPTQTTSPVLVPTSNDSPSFTTISGPSNVLVSQSYSFNFSATDPNNDNLAWGVQWGDNAGTGSACPATQPNNTFSASHTWNKVGVYTVNLAISDCKGHGAEKSFSVNVAANTSDSSTLSSTNTIYNSSSVSATTPSDSSASSSAQTSRVIVPGPTPVQGSTTVTVLSPNGGEKWVKGTTQNIRWQDNITMPPCPTGSFCPQVMPVYKYDIKLLSYYTPCASNICPSYMIPSPRTIASGVYGTQDIYGFSYSWTIPNCTSNNPCSSNLEIPEASYMVQICRSGTNSCDSSNNYFQVVNGTTDSTPSLSISLASNTPTSQSIYPGGNGYTFLIVNLTADASSDVLVSKINFGVSGGAGPYVTNLRLVNASQNVIALPDSSNPQLFVPNFVLSKGTTQMVKLVGDLSPNAPVGTQILYALTSQNVTLSGKVAGVGVTGTAWPSAYTHTVVANPAHAILPTINSFSPASGPIGTQVTINGTGFTSGGITYLKFGAGTIFVSPTSDTQITFTIPSSMGNCNTNSCTSVIIPVNPGSYSLTAINANGGNTAANNFTVTTTGN